MCDSLKLIVTSLYLIPSAAFLTSQFLSYRRERDSTICNSLTRSQFAVPLLDRLFTQPIFQSTHLAGQKGMPSKPMVMQMLGRLRRAGILRVVREGSGRRAQVLALAELVNLSEGRKII